MRSTAFGLAAAGALLLAAAPGVLAQCDVSYPSYVGDGGCDSSGNYNTMACSWDGGDCCTATGGSSDYYCLDPLYRPSCNESISSYSYLGDGGCDSSGYYNTERCGWDGGDCCTASGGTDGDYYCEDPDNQPSGCAAEVSYFSYVGDGSCDSYGGYNTEVCDWDGGDCCTASGGTDGDYYCEDPDNQATGCAAEVSYYTYVGDGSCDSYGGYNTEICDWDGGDCCTATGGSDDDDCLDPDNAPAGPSDACIAAVSSPSWIGDGGCDSSGMYNTALCDWDGGDCCSAAGGNTDTYCLDPLNPPPYPDCPVTYTGNLGDGYCDGYSYNKRACGWDGGDCCTDTCVGGSCYVGTYSYQCKNVTSPLAFPQCNITGGEVLGDGSCSSSVNTMNCGWDGGDCCQMTCDGDAQGGCSSGSFDCQDPDAPEPPAPTYPYCTVSSQNFLGDGYCDGGYYNVLACGWDGGDCCETTCTNSTFTCGTAGYSCNDFTQSGLCDVTYFSQIGDGACDSTGNYNTWGCGWDGGDCCEYTCTDGDSTCGTSAYDCKDPYGRAFVCNVWSPGYVGDGECDATGGYNTYACGWDGGDCCASSCENTTAYTCGEGGYDCRDTLNSGYRWGSCQAGSLSFLGDGYCDGGTYNTMSCGWDGGDCCPFSCLDTSFYTCGSNDYNCADPANSAYINLQFQIVSTIALDTPLNSAALRATLLLLLGIDEAAVVSFNVAAAVSTRRALQEGQTYIVTLILRADAIESTKSMSYLVEEELAEDLEEDYAGSAMTVSAVVVTDSNGPVEDAEQPPVNTVGIVVGVIVAVIVVGAIVGVAVYITNKNNLNKHVELQEEPAVAHTRTDPYKADKADTGAGQANI